MPRKKRRSAQNADQRIYGKSFLLSTAAREAVFHRLLLPSLRSVAAVEEYHPAEPWVQERLPTEKNLDISFLYQ